jgi:hypothetical protein
MYVVSVEDELGRYVVSRKHRTGNPWSAMCHRRHSVAQMGRMPCTGVNRYHRLIQRRTGVTQRYARARNHQSPNYLDRTRQFRSKSHNADIRPAAYDDVENVPRRKLSRPVCGLAQRPPQALEWLRAAEVEIDEIAFKVRRQYAGTLGRALCACLRDPGQYGPERCRCTRDRCRTKGGDVVTR